MLLFKLSTLQTDAYLNHILQGNVPAAQQQLRFMANALKYHNAPLCSDGYVELSELYKNWDNKAALEMERALDELIVATEKNFERALKVVKDELVAAITATNGFAKINLLSLRSAVEAGQNDPKTRNHIIELANAIETGNGDISSIIKKLKG